MIPVSVQLALALIGLSALVTGCPVSIECVCDFHEKSMLCNNLESVTWTGLVEQIPDYVEKLWIEATIFDTEPWNRATFIRSKPTIIIPVKLNVHYLHIIGSSLVNLDKVAFQTMPNLKELHLNEVNLNREVISYLSFLKQVEVVDLSNNKLEEVPVDLLQSWPEIQRLNLSHNEFTEFNFHIFSELLTIQSIDLSYNHISFIYPDSFENGTSLIELNLQSNDLQYLHQKVIMDMGDPVTVHLGNNPWGCHCGLAWLVKALNSHIKSNVTYANPGLIRCASPVELQSTKLADLDNDQLRCEEPDFLVYPQNQSLHFLQNNLLQCNVSGYPLPSVYWMTPHGPIVHPNHRYWVPSDVATSPDSIWLHARPSYFHAAVRALSDGSLLFEDFRYYFDGQYTCVAVNPAGSVDHSVNVTILVTMPTTIKFSLLWGFCSVGFFVLICTVVGAIIHCSQSSEKFDLSQYYPELTITYPDEYYISSDEQSDESFCYDRSPLQSYKHSPYRSPKKCVTPAEGLDPDRRFPEGAGNIRETLESVRARLRLNMEKQVDKMRSQAQHVKQTSHRYMKNVKTSTGRTMKSLRHTSSQYVHKMREGMVLGVEQVKNHVQSMKELCGTGHMSHTISTISVSTDIDSNQKKAVVKSITYV